MSVHRCLAPAKVNLGLFVGPIRPGDGRHELATVMQAISLADELVLSPAPAAADGDEVLCEGVAGPPGENIAARALRAFRERTGWDAPPQRLEIVKRIPVAAGLGGGSADAAATLRLAGRAAGFEDPDVLRELAASLGADVPALLSPGRWLASGAGEELEELPPPSSRLGVLVLPVAVPLSTAHVYAQADALGGGRSLEELHERRGELRAALSRGAPLPAASELLHNDLQRAATSLCPETAALLRSAREAGAEAALVSGSGPTVIGLFARELDGTGALDRARRAAEKLAGRTPPPTWACSVDAAYAAVAAD